MHTEGMSEKVGEFLTKRIDLEEELSPQRGDFPTAYIQGDSVGPAAS